MLHWLQSSYKSVKDKILYQIYASSNIYVYIFRVEKLGQLLCTITKTRNYFKTTKIGTLRVNSEAHSFVAAAGAIF